MFFLMMRRFVVPSASVPSVPAFSLPAASLDVAIRDRLGCLHIPWANHKLPQLDADKAQDLAGLHERGALRGTGEHTASQMK